MVPSQPPSQDQMHVGFDIEQCWPWVMRAFLCVTPVAAALSLALILMGLLGTDHAHDTLFTSLGYAALVMFALTFTLVGIIVTLAILSAWRVVAWTLLIVALGGAIAAVGRIGVLTTLLLVIAIGVWRIVSVRFEPAVAKHRPTITT